MNTFSIGNINSSKYGLYVSGKSTFNSPEKDYTKVSVPGRNGDLLYFNNRFKNVILEYEAIVVPERAVLEQGESKKNYEECTSDIRNWLLSQDSYFKLTDDYHPDEYRMASFIGPMDFDTILLEAGSVTLQFDCKPQRFLNSGETEITVSNGTTLKNPTLFKALPLLHINSGTNKNGVISFGGSSLSISDTSSTLLSKNLYIDVETQDCYEIDGTLIRNRNSYLTVSNNVWPVLKPGNNSFTLSTITSITVIPRWWKL